MFDAWANQGQMTAPNYLKDSLDAAGVPIRQVWMNDRLRLADPRVAMEVLHPPRFGVGGRDNASSLLLVVEYAGKRILLPGDLESPGIESVIAEPPLEADILLAPHHGSNYSNPPGFAAWCTPEWVVLSGGSPNASTTATTASYTASGAEVLHTAQSGTVEFGLFPTGITRRCYLP
jgi:competence protein ComEC